jgi:hypothetical protein
LLSVFASCKFETFSSNPDLAIHSLFVGEKLCLTVCGELNKDKLMFKFSALNPGRILYNLVW